MPELPEVETIRRGMEAALPGPGRHIKRLVLNRPDMRYPFTPGMTEALTGKAVQSLGRRGKYIITPLAEKGGTLIWHLGMSGRIRIIPPNGTYTPQQHDHAVFYMDDGGVIAFNDPRRFGFLLYYKDDNWQKTEPFASMGPEPLGNDFNAPALAGRLKGRKGPIKTALLDQKVIAGLGNIYVCEALYQAEISPLRSAGSLSEQETEHLCREIRDVLTRALESGGSSLRDYRHTDGALGYFQHRFSVYDREGQTCPACPTSKQAGCSIRRIVQAGRSTFYCPNRQH